MASRCSSYFYPTHVQEDSCCALLLGTGINLDRTTLKVAGELPRGLSCRSAGTTWLPPLLPHGSSRLSGSVPSSIGQPTQASIPRRCGGGGHTRLLDCKARFNHTYGSAENSHVRRRHEALCQQSSTVNSQQASTVNSQQSTALVLGLLSERQPRPAIVFW